MRSSFPRFLVALVLFATACAPQQAPSPPQPQPTTGAQTQPTGPKRAANQVLRVGTNLFPAGVTQFASAFNIPWYGAQFDALVNFDKDFNIVPGIATKWELLPDNSAWRFTLRKDLVFSNGDKLTADDVAFTIETQTKERTPQWALSPFLRGAKVISEDTVDLIISQRDVSTLFNGPGWLIWPKKYYESAGKDGFVAKPVGSGPYELAEFKPGDRIVYRKRTDREHPFRKPIATEIQIRAVPDATALFNGLKTGELDMLHNISVLPEQVKKAKDEGMQVDVIQASYLSVLFNNEKIKGGPMADSRVRLAMNYAVDRESIAKNVFAGFAESIGQFAAPGAPHYNPNLKSFPFDPARARQLLAEAGYPNGFNAGGLIFSGSPLNAQIFQAIQSMHRDVGITYEIEPVEIGTYVDVSYGRGNKPRRELMHAGASNTNGVFSFTWFFLKCDGGGGWYCVQELDRNMEKALAEPDATKRIPLLQAATKSITDELPMVFLVSTPFFIVRNPKVQDLKWVTQNYFTFDSLYLSE